MSTTSTRKLKWSKVAAGFYVTQNGWTATVYSRGEPGSGCLWELTNSRGEQVRCPGEWAPLAGSLAECKKFAEEAASVQR